MSTQIIISIIIAALALLSFVLQKVPVGVTALCASMAMVIFGVLTPSEFIGTFGNDTAVMVAACIILGNAMFETGAATTIGKIMIDRFKNSRLLLCGIVLVAALLSAFLSNTAVTAMFIPLLASAARSSDGRVTKKGTYMAVGIASVVGGNCTLAGSTPQMVAQGILSTTEGVRELTFWELGKIGFPLVALLVLYYLFIGEPLQKKVFTEDVPDLITDSSAQDDGESGRLSGKQILILCILGACILGFSSGIWSLGAVAAICAIISILTGCISFERAFSTMDWNTVMVLIGATGLSNGLNKSGFISMAAISITDLFGGPAANARIICVAIIMLSALLGNLMSHTATAAAIVPLAISIAQNLGVNPIPYVVAVVIGSNLAFATPISTPPLTMTLVGGYRFTDYTIVGGIYNIFSLILACVLIPVVYPF